MQQPMVGSRTGLTSTDGNDIDGIGFCLFLK
jgi:hypothetical protein